MISIAALALTLLTSPARMPDEAKDWEFVPARWEAMVPALSQAVGMPVQVNQKIRDEVVVGRFVHKTREEMMAAFAKATGTMWTVEQGTLVIRPDGRARADAESAMEDQVVANFQKWMDKSNVGEVDKKTLESKIKEAYALQSKTEEGGFDWQSIQKIDRYSPGVQLANLFMRQVGARELAKSDGDERIVYSTNPTTFQKPLGAFGNTLIERARVMQKNWLDSLDLVQAGLGHAPSEGGYYMNLIQRPYNKGEITQALVVLRKQSGTSMVTVKFLDQTNNTVLQGNASASLYSSYIEDNEVTGDQPAKQTPPEPRFKSTVDFDQRDAALGKIALTLDSKSHLKPEDRLAVLKDMAGWLDHDPMDGTCTRLLFGLSKEANKDVAGLVPDSMMYLAWSNRNEATMDAKPIPVQLVYSYLDATSRIFKLVKEDDNGFTFSLSVPESLSGGFIPRRTVAFMASQYLKKGKLDFDDLAQVALASDSKENFDRVIQVMQAVIGGDVRSSMMSSSSMSGTVQDQYTTLRLYGSLPKQAKLNAQKGKVTLAVDQLPPGAQKEVYKALLDLDYGLMPKGQAIDWEAYQSMSQEEQQRISEMQSATQRRMEPFGELASEPTFILAQPVSRPLVVELSMGQSSKILGDNGQEWGSRVTNIDELARNQALGMRAQEQGQSNSYYAPIQTFAQFSVDQLTIKITAGGLWECSYLCEFNNSQIPEGQPIDKMPADFRANFTQLVEKYYKEYENVHFGGNGSSTTIKPFN